MKRWMLSVAAVLSTTCGGGVPIQVELDDLAIDVSIDDVVSELELALRQSGALPPRGSIPETWPEQLPDVCFEQRIETTGEQVIAVDLTPDPAADPAAAEQLEGLDDGVVDRMEIDRIVLRIEENTMNVPLPPLELQAADQKDAGSDEDAVWWTLGTIGGTVTSSGCPLDAAKEAVLAQPGEEKEVPFVFARGGESFLLQQLMDPRCAELQREAGAPEDPLACKELAIRARALLVYDTASRPQRPSGSVRLRFVLGATFFVNP